MCLLSKIYEGSVKYKSGDRVLLKLKTSHTWATVTKSLFGKLKFDVDGGKQIDFNPDMIIEKVNVDRKNFYA